MDATRDTVHLTPAQVLSSLEDIAMQLTTVNDLGERQVAEAIDALDQLYNAADGNEPLRDCVVRVGNRVQSLAHLANQSVAHAVVATEFAKEMDVLFQELATEHNDLYEAVECADRSHPHVASLIEDIEAEAYEDGERDGNRAAMTHELVERIGELLRWHDDSPAAIGKFLNVYFGDTKLTDAQIAGFLAWIESVSE